VLRLDDDERCSPAMVEWLMRGDYQLGTHWKFARVALFGSEWSAIDSPHLWPDHQTRLSVRAWADGRNAIHCGSPYGGGDLAPAAIEHHKFLVKNTEERLALAQHYDRVGGSGTGWNYPFNVPELAYAEMQLRRYDGNGVVAEMFR
jgi:hypothetical protein